MRRGLFAALAVVSSALGTGLLACFDLFHSTADILTACEVDALAPGCPPRDANVEAEAGAASGETNFCEWSPSLARQHAQHACAWLGACESPLGGNAFGACMFQALLAYDCASNPNHRVKGKAHALWDCLAKATSCDAVDACVLPAGAELCASGVDYTACGLAGSGAASNSDVRIECVADGGRRSRQAYGENCALWGKTCAFGGASAVCAGAGNLGCQQPGIQGGCASGLTELQWCVNGSDIGIDCAGNGAQSCNAFRASTGVPWVACVAESDAGTCAPDASANCANGVASSCPSGVLETIDCASLLSPGSACEGGPLSPPFDWTSPCMGSGTCAESCADAGLLVGCARGTAFVVNCAAEGLGACRTVATDTQSELHTACTPPP
jgi:hypothetical protein